MCQSQKYPNVYTRALSTQKEILVFEWQKTRLNGGQKVLERAKLNGMKTFRNIHNGDEAKKKRYCVRKSVGKEYVTEKKVFDVDFLLAFFNRIQLNVVMLMLFVANSISIWLME